MSVSFADLREVPPFLTLDFSLIDASTTLGRFRTVFWNRFCRVAWSHEWARKDQVAATDEVGIFQRHQDCWIRVSVALNASAVFQPNVGMVTRR